MKGQGARENVASIGRGRRRGQHVDEVYDGGTAEGESAGNGVVNGGKGEVEGGGSGRKEMNKGGAGQNPGGEGVGEEKERIVSAEFLREDKGRQRPDERYEKERSQGEGGERKGDESHGATGENVRARRPRWGVKFSDWAAAAPVRKKEHHRALAATLYASSHPVHSLPFPMISSPAPFDSSLHTCDYERMRCLHAFFSPSDITRFIALTDDV